MKPTEREPLLFDLPPVSEPEVPVPAQTPASRRRSASAGGKVLPLFLDLPAQPPNPIGGEEVEAWKPPAGRLVHPELTPDAAFPSRLLAGSIDLLILGAVCSMTALGAHALLPGGSTWKWQPVLLFVLVFSLFAIVLPLAFWRRTAGMALLKLEARALDGTTMTFRQSFARWLGGLMTVLGAGVPVLIALSGRSLADRISGSRTLSSANATASSR